MNIPEWTEITALLLSLIQNANFWVTVSFAGLIALALYFRAPSQITRALDQQRAAIIREVEEAEQLYDQAQRLLQQHEAKLAAIQSESDGFMRAAKQKASDYHTEHSQAITEKIQRQEEIAEKRIENARQEAINSLKQEAVALAFVAAKKLIVENTDHKKLIHIATAEIETGLKHSQSQKH